MNKRTIPQVSRDSGDSVRTGDGLRGSSQPEKTAGRVCPQAPVFQPPLSCLRMGLPRPGHQVPTEKGPTSPVLGLALCVGLSFPALGRHRPVLFSLEGVTWHLANPPVGLNALAREPFPSTLAQKDVRRPVVLPQPPGETFEPRGPHSLLDTDAAPFSV